MTTVRDLKELLSDYPEMAELCINIISMDDAELSVKSKGKWYWLVKTDGKFPSNEKIEIGEEG